MGGGGTNGLRRLACLGLLALTGCGGGERQDEDEPEGDFEVEVVEASFPKQQQLAKRSELVITLRNAGDRTIPNIALTVDGFNYSKTDSDLADRSRPTFAINGVAQQVGGLPEARPDTPRGCDSAYVNTWAFGPLLAGRERSFKWSVTPVRAGEFKISWRAAAGLSGKAKAVAGGGGAPRGSFTGSISDEASQSRVGDDGKSVVEATP
ncbi:MAG TPA: hypothetical protein VEQ61_04220 [Thermoleophilaceae bacterium]|nr:hypothetical protein [Thermoleophilaceae bacterium]